jgi:excisionase family DNA binding protein
MRTQTTPRWASIDDAADYLEVNPRTVRRMISAGDIPGHRLGPRLIRVDLNEVDKSMRLIPNAGGRNAFA